MAKLFLESTDTQYVVSNSNTAIFGAAGNQAVIIDGDLTGITLNSNVERVEFDGATADYTYKQTGTQLEVYKGNQKVSTIGLTSTGSQLTFAEGTVTAKIVPPTTAGTAPTISFGDQTVSSTANAAVTPTVIDKTISSAPAPVFSVDSAVTSVTEAAGATATFTVSLNAAQPAETSVTLALSGVGTATTADYGSLALATGSTATFANNILTFPAGTTTATFTVPVSTDAITETGEGVKLTLSVPSTGASVEAVPYAEVLIQDPPTPVFSLSASATSVAEGTPAVGTTAAVAAGTVTLTVTRSGNTAGTDSVVVQATSGTGTSGAISGSDFTALSQTVTFAPNDTVKTVTFTSIADSTREGDETLTVSLGTPSAGSSINSAASLVTLTITNDDANLLPVITIPTTTPSAFIGSSTAITGISFTDGDDNTGFTVTVQASGSSQVSYTQDLTSLTVGAKNSAGSVVNYNQTSNTIVFTGTKADLNTVLSTLKYTTNSTVPTAEQVTITITDAAGGVATKTLPINIGQSSTLTSSNDSFVGSAGDDEFNGTLTNLTNSSDTINGGNGTDKLVLTGVNSTVAGTISNVEVLDLALTGTATVTVSATNFGSALTTVNASVTSGTPIVSGTFNSGTTFNFGAATIDTLTVTDLLVPSTSASTGSATTDVINLNFNGSSTVASVLTTLTAASSIDVLNIVSNGSYTTANSIGTFNDLATNATVNVSGAQAFTATLPDLGTGAFNGASATGKLTITADADDSAAITGGSAGDVLTGNAGLDTINGGAGNDTINGGAAVDSITGGTGADSLSGGAGNDVFVFAAGDSGNTSTTRDTLADLAEGDIIKFGTALTGLTNGATLGSTGTVRIDATNKLLVVGTDEINIPTSVANATFTYSYGADSVVGTADDYLTVGAAPFTATNNALGTLTLTGKAIATVSVDLSANSSTGAPVVGGNAVGNNAVRTVVASTVTNAGISVTGSTGADTITGTAQADTITGGAGADVITAGNGDTLVYAASSGETYGGAAITSGTTDIRSGLDIVTAPTTTGNTLLLDLAGVGSTIADATITQATSGNGDAGTTGDTLIITKGTYVASTGIFTSTSSSPTHTLIQYDTNSTTAGGVQDILIIGTFTSAAVASEILTLTV